MIKKSTLLVLLGAIALGAAVYFFDWKRGQKEAEKPATDTAKAAFSIPAGSEITSLVLSRPTRAGEPPIDFEKQNGFWQITKPIQTGADQHLLQTMVEGIGGARIETTEPGAPDRLKVYGLDPPAVTVEFKLQDGSQHSLKLGNKDFTNNSAYAIVDGAKDVALLPASLLTSTDLSLDDLRDRNVLDFAAGDVGSFDLKNSTGEIAATKGRSGWTFTKPAAGSFADETDVSALFSAIGGAKMTAIVSESSDNLGKYGLTSPAVSFTATDTSGKSASLFVGRKEGDSYFAKDAARPLIFRIDDKLYQKLNENYSVLRDKKLIHLTAGDLNRAELHNANGLIIIVPKSEQDWTVEAPADLKGKTAATWKILTPVLTARADEIADHPTADVLAKLAKPLVQITLTAKYGKTVTLSFTAEIGDLVYARTSNGPAVYKLKKNIIFDLNSKLADFAF